MGVFRKIRHLAGETINHYDMLKSGDKILVASSGGKDSITLLDILLSFKKHAPFDFEIFAVHIDAGFHEPDAVEKLLMAKQEETKNKKNEPSFEFHIEKTKIKEVLEKENQSCFLCSRLRRGIIYKLAQDFSCTKVALGHNLDDANETFMLNFTYCSKFQTMQPIYLSDDKKNTIIRPLIEVPEDLIIKFQEESNMVIAKQKCPLKPSDSRRELMKQTLQTIKQDSKFYDASTKNTLRKINKIDKQFFK